MFEWLKRLFSQPKPGERYSIIDRETTWCMSCGDETRTLMMKNPDQRLCAICFGKK